VPATRNSIKLIHEGKYSDEVPIELIEDDTAWAPYLLCPRKTFEGSTQSVSL